MRVAGRWKRRKESFQLAPDYHRETGRYLRWVLDAPRATGPRRRAGRCVCFVSGNVESKTTANVQHRWSSGTGAGSDLPTHEVKEVRSTPLRGSPDPPIIIYPSAR